MIQLIHGENFYNSWQDYKKTVAKYKDKNFYDDEYLLSNDLSFDAIGLFSSNQTYVIKHFFSLPKDRQEVLANNIFAHEKNEIIIWEDNKIDKRSRIYKNFVAKADVREHLTLKDNELSIWIKKELDKKQLPLANQHKETLAFYYGSDQTIISNEILKLKGYYEIYGEEKLNENFHSVISTPHNASSWDFIDKFFKADKNFLFKYLETIENEVGVEYALIGALTSQLRILFLIGKYNDFELKNVISKLKIHPYRVKVSLAYKKFFTIEKVKRIYSMLCNLEYSLKRSELTPKMGLTLLVASL